MRAICFVFFFPRIDVVSNSLKGTVMYQEKIRKEIQAQSGPLRRFCRSKDGGTLFAVWIVKSGKTKYLFEAPVLPATMT